MQKVKEKNMTILSIQVCGSDVGPSDDEAQRGIEAARAYCESEGISVEEAMHLDDSGEWSEHFTNIQNVALDACFAGWVQIPESAHLVAE